MTAPSTPWVPKPHLPDRRPLPPVDGRLDELLAKADLAFLGTPSGRSRSAAFPGAEGVEVEMAIREILIARPGISLPSPVGPAVAVVDRPRLWVAVEAGEAAAFRTSIPGVWFVTMSGHAAVSCTRTDPGRFVLHLGVLRELCAGGHRPATRP